MYYCQSGCRDASHQRRVITPKITHNDIGVCGYTYIKSSWSALHPSRIFITFIRINTHRHSLSVHQRFLQNDRGLLQNYVQHMRHKENTEVFRRLTHADSPCYRPATTCDCCREHSGELVSPGNLTHQMESLAKSKQMRFVSLKSHLIGSPWKAIGRTICLWRLIQTSHFFSTILCSFFKWETDVQLWSSWPHYSHHCLQASSSILQTIQLKGFHDGSERFQTGLSSRTLESHVTLPCNDQTELDL